MTTSTGMQTCSISTPRFRPSRWSKLCGHHAGAPHHRGAQISFESVKNPLDFKTADIRTKLNTLIITSGEQQTMNFYMNLGNTYCNDPGRRLYLEIAMIEEQHVSQYGSLLDP